MFAFGRKTAAVSQYVRVLKQRMLMDAVKRRDTILKCWNIKRLDVKVSPLVLITHFSNSLSSILAKINHLYPTAFYIFPRCPTIGTRCQIWDFYRCLWLRLLNHHKSSRWLLTDGPPSIQTQRILKFCISRKNSRRHERLPPFSFCFPDSAPDTLPLSSHLV